MKRDGQEKLKRMKIWDQEKPQKIVFDSTNYGRRVILKIKAHSTGHSSMGVATLLLLENNEYAISGNKTLKAMHSCMEQDGC